MTIEIFRDMDELVEVGSRIGYNGGGSQLKPGTLRIHRQNHSIGTISVIRHRAIGAVDYWGDPPGSHFTFIVPLHIDWYRVNLESPLSNDVVLIPPASEIAITTHGHDQFIVYVPTSHFQRYLGNDYSLRLSNLDRTQILKVHNHWRQQLIRLLVEASQGDGYIASTANLEHQICEVLATLLRGQEVDSGVDPRGDTKMRALRRARDFIMAHMNNNLTISDISNAAGVSERTLQRLFKNEFQLPPVKYIKSQRLEAVRQALLQNASSTQPISTLAAEYGFSHMGRFSIEFKQQFGALPKEYRRDTLGSK